MKKTAFITGITGQDGSFLAELLLKKETKVVGLISQKHDIGLTNIKTIKDKLILEEGDLLDKSSLEKIIKKHQPDEIYNLASLTFIPKAWQEPSLTLDINTLGTTRLLEIIRDHSPKTKFYQATSSKVFGKPLQSPQTETTPLNPVDPYSISKAASHFITISFRERFNLFAVSGILYNHESERRGTEFVSRKITNTAAKIKLGLETKLSLGNLESKQDFGYAPDYVEAMYLMLQNKTPQDFIISTNKLHSVKDICKIAFDFLELDYKNYVVRDEKFYRPIEAQAPIGDYFKAKKMLGWKPRTSFKDMIIKMVKNDLELEQVTNTTKVRNNCSNI